MSLTKIRFQDQECKLKTTIAIQGNTEDSESNIKDFFWNLADYPNINTLQINFESKAGGGSEILKNSNGPQKLLEELALNTTITNLIIRIARGFDREADIFDLIAKLLEKTQTISSLTLMINEGTFTSNFLVALEKNNTLCELTLHVTEDKNLSALILPIRRNENITKFCIGKNAVSSKIMDAITTLETLATDIRKTWLKDIFGMEVEHNVADIACDRANEIKVLLKAGIEIAVIKEKIQTLKTCSKFEMAKIGKDLLVNHFEGNDFEDSEPLQDIMTEFAHKNAHIASDIAKLFIKYGFWGKALDIISNKFAEISYDELLEELFKTPSPEVVYTKEFDSESKMVTFKAGNEEDETLNTYRKICEVILSNIDDFATDHTYITSNENAKVMSMTLAIAIMDHLSTKVLSEEYVNALKDSFANRVIGTEIKDINTVLDEIVKNAISMNLLLDFSNQLSIETGVFTYFENALLSLRDHGLDTEAVIAIISNRDFMDNFYGKESTKQVLAGDVPEIAEDI